MQQVAVNYIRNALNDTSGNMTKNLVVTVTVYSASNPGTAENIDASQASSLDLLVISVSIPYQDVRWVALQTITAHSLCRLSRPGSASKTTRFPQRHHNLPPAEQSARE